MLHLTLDNYMKIERGLVCLPTFADRALVDDQKLCFLWKISLEA